MVLVGVGLPVMTRDRRTVLELLAEAVMAWCFRSAVERLPEVSEPTLERMEMDEEVLCRALRDAGAAPKALEKAARKLG